jgi:hypothetical protein
VGEGERGGLLAKPVYKSGCLERPDKHAYISRLVARIFVATMSAERYQSVSDALSRVDRSCLDDGFALLSPGLPL